MLERAILRLYRRLRWKWAHRRGDKATPEYERLYTPGK